MTFDQWWEASKQHLYQDSNSHEAARSAWNEALEQAANSFSAQAGSMQMSVEQRLLITVAERIRNMQAQR